MSQAVRFAADKNYDQKVISFRELGRNYILWSAYPRVGDGAKLEILPGAIEAIAPATRDYAIRTLQSLSREPISDKTTLRVPFRALKSQERRATVKAVLERLIAELAEETSEVQPPSSS
jgi:hypothetical protein